MQVVEIIQNSFQYPHCASVWKKTHIHNFVKPIFFGNVSCNAVDGFGVEGKGLFFCLCYCMKQCAFQIHYSR
eukprot:Gb_12073 [translate_table: standard]